MGKFIWTNEKRPVKDLLPADYNPRKLTVNQRANLIKSIEKFDAVEPVVINTGTRANVLIGGHQRVKVYADLGFTEIDVRVPNKELTLAEEKELNIRLNKNVGGWDNEKLLSFDEDFLKDVGFEDDDLLFYHAQDEQTFNLPTAEKGKFQQITFILSNEQAIAIQAAMAKVDNKEAEILGNKNKNGNAIYTIVDQWEKQRKSE